MKGRFIFVRRENSKISSLQHFSLLLNLVFVVDDTLPSFERKITLLHCFIVVIVSAWLR
jgi:hypothetical protein